jgi:hypothetical protein
MPVTAEPRRFEAFHLDPGDDGDPVHAFLAGEMDVPVTCRFECLPRELVLKAFDLLEAKDVRLLAA